MQKAKKATWLHRFPSTEDEVRAIVRRLAEAGFDMLIPCVKQVTGIADYHSGVARVREEYRDWDPLAVCADEASKAGIDVHAWCCVFVEGNDSALIAEHPEYAAVPGEELPAAEGHAWACHTRPEVRDYEFSLYRELIDNYPIAGVHLDYIRTSSGLCFCDYCKQDYHKKTGGDLSCLGTKWRDPDAQDLDVWIRWRCAPVTDLVTRVRKAAVQAGKQTSAAVFHYYPGGLLDIGQDWEQWVREDLLDYVFPMNYSTSTAIAAKWTRNNAATLKDLDSDCRLWEGLLRPAHMDTARFMQHVEAILAAGVEGITIFEYSYLSDEDLVGLKSLPRY